MRTTVVSIWRAASLALCTLFALGALGLAPGPAQGALVIIESPPPGFGEVVVPAAPGVLPFVPLTSLGGVPNPVIPGWPAAPALRADLAEYVADLPAAIRLGKAIFWEMQAGSDNRTACATCHFNAGADIRARNQLSPGADGTWSPDAPNATLAQGSFPFTSSGGDRDSIAGSQGIRRSAFQGLSKSGAELTVSVADPIFGVGGANVRQVTGIHSPSALNAVFNHRQFWNGRAQPEFNGVNPFGRRDPSARVWALDPRGLPVPMVVTIQDASLASQAVGPPLNTVEMSAAGRTFPDLGKKMLSLKPLGLQKVSPSDSVLGSLAASTKGLSTTYKAMIQTAFKPKWWNSTKNVSVGGKSYTMMQANFSLFWGLSVMLYEATLVSDQSPMDRYLASRVFDPATGELAGHDPMLLAPLATRLASEYGYSGGVDGILNGLDLFEKPVSAGPDGLPQIPPPGGGGAGCSLCHVGAETTGASLRRLAGHGLEPGDDAFKNAGFDLRLERMFMSLPPVPVGTTSITYDTTTYAVTPSGGSPVKIAVYDAGWYNIGVRPTSEGLGVGGSDPWGGPLSWTEYFQKMLADPASIDVPGGGLGAPTSPPAAPATSPFAGEVLNPLTGFPLLAGRLRASEATDVAGSFKTPGLRNVELTGPYLHNGGKSTLMQTVAFYGAGGDFPANPTLSPLMVPRGMTSVQMRDLVAFLLSLTDDRVLYQKAPFDHPELLVPSGQTASGSDITTTMPAVGAAGGPRLERFLSLDPFAP